MHRTLKQEATKPAAKNFLQQQGRFDTFLEGFNNERPHEAIGMRYPSELYHSSPRFYQGIGELDYPFHDFTITVTACGRICIVRARSTSAPPSQGRTSASARTYPLKLVAGA